MESSPPSYEMTVQHQNAYSAGGQYPVEYPPPGHYHYPEAEQYPSYGAGYYPSSEGQYPPGPGQHPPGADQFSPVVTQGYHGSENHGVTHSGGEVPRRPPIPPRPPQHVVDAHFNNTGQTDQSQGQTEQTPYHQVAPVTTRQGSEGSNPTGGNNEEQEEKNQFSEKSIRLGFIKKVFAILLCQLAFTAAMMCLLLFVKPIRKYLRFHDWLYITSMVLTILLMAVFAFIPKLRRTWPWNLVFLLIITFFMSVTLGAVASTMDSDEVLMAVGIVCVVVIVCVILGFQRKFDFTPLVGFVAILGTCVAAFAFLNIFFHSRVLRVVFAALGAFIFSMWLLLDIQLMLKGKHKLSLSPEEYVSGALNLYIDIVYILFMIFVIFKRT